MKKFLFFSFFAILAMGTVAYGQYNKIYSASNSVFGYVKQYSIDIIDAGNGETCVLSTDQLGANLTLKELDVNGVVNFHITHTVTDGSLRPSKLLQAANGDYIVVGMHMGVNSNNPFAARFDNVVGGLIWFNMFESNSSKIFMSSSYFKANVVLAADDPNESYILTAPGDAFQAPFSDPGNYTVNAIKFDGSGNQVWNKKYGYDASDPFNASNIHMQLAPVALAYGPGNDNYGKYFIAGMSSNQYLIESGFHMAIDGNGTVVNSYEEYTNEPGYPFGHSAIYDASTNEFIMTYTFGASYTGGAVVSQIVISKYDFTNLGFNSTDMYWENDPAATVSENYGFSIREDATGSAYILACFVSKTTMSTQWGTSALLKVDKMGNPLIFNRYNIGTQNAPAAIASSVDGSMTERYVIAAYTFVAGSEDVRVISTNTTGDVCGSEPMQYGTAAYSITKISPPWNNDFIWTPTYSYTTSTDGTVTPTDCDSMNPQYKTTSVATTITSGNFNVYPSILSDGDRLINFDITIIHQTDLSVVMYSIEGKEIAGKYISLPKGQNRFSWEAVPELPGNYIISIKSADGLLSKTARITRL